MAWFASCLFMGQAAGVALAGLVVDAAGAAMLFGMTALLLPLLGCGFAWALRRHAAAQTAQAA
ncbi:membrane transport protein [Bordetella pertussis]|nr:membrane transport protein [Bordetella pertussis]